MNLISEMNGYNKEALRITPVHYNITRSSERQFLEVFEFWIEGLYVSLKLKVIKCI